MLSLTSHEHVKLAHAPINLAALQFHFEDVGDLVRSDARSVQKALGIKAWSDLQAVQIITGVLGPAGFGQQLPRPAWQLGAPDSSQAVALNSDSAALETNVYPGWERYKATFAQLVHAVSETVSPRESRRLGLRYVNQIAMPSGHGSWDDLIPDELLGPAASRSPFSTGVVATEQRVVLGMEKGLKCLLRHGSFSGPQGQPLYLLDFDIFRDTPTVFDASAIIEEVEGLHNAVYDLFRVTITAELFQRLR